MRHADASKTDGSRGGNASTDPGCLGSELEPCLWLIQFISDSCL
jgi:hypothetical protein